MVATIKIIPYAVSEEALADVLSGEPQSAISFHPYKAQRVGLISTLLPSLKPAIVDKTRAMLERRLALSGSSISADDRVLHRRGELEAAIRRVAPECDLLVIFGASAISDVGDFIPAAVRGCGGQIKRFGMPVDPGNLLLVAELDGKPVLGAPGCARSPAENGFDWVLQRLLAGVPVDDEVIRNMGVGGLLMETGARPHPREQKVGASQKTAAIILAAGQSRRMGKSNKMTVAVRGKPMVRHVAEAALASGISDVFVVTGHEQEAVRNVLEDLNLQFVHNPDYADGLSTSLRAGISALGPDHGSALILLGDMPFVTSEMIDEMKRQAEGKRGSIIVSTSSGKRGNPVLWPRAYFAELSAIEGDVGARHIIGANADAVVEVELGEAAATDLDTPEAVRALE